MDFLTHNEAGVHPEFFIGEGGGGEPGADHEDTYIWFLKVML
jgi:hypothetical protein